MDLKESMFAYPRFDSAFRKKHSYNFDMMRSNIFLNRDDEPVMYVWLAYAMMGVIIGSIAFLMEILEKETVTLREYLMQRVLSDSDNNQVIAWLFLAGFAFIYAIVASSLTVYFGPGANGSGIAEIMAILNGVNYPGYIGF